MLQLTPFEVTVKHCFSPHIKPVFAEKKTLKFRLKKNINNQHRNVDHV